MRRLTALHTISLLMLLLPFTGRGQQFNFRTYSLNEGLAQSQVYAMLQDSRGYIWMGTRGGGLSCFDGVSFRNYTVKEGLVDNYILSLCEDGKGRVWIGTNRGVSVFNGQQFRSYSISDSGTVAVEAMVCKNREQLYLGTSKGLFLFNGTSFRPVLKENKLLNKYITALYLDSKGSLWAGNNQGVNRIRGEKCDHFGKKEGMKSELVRCITEDREGTIWVGTYGGGLSRIKGNRLVSMYDKDLLPDRIILALKTDSKGNVWIGTQEAGAGYWHPQDSSFRFLSETDGLSNNHVHSIIEDSWGNLWFGTSGGGACKYYGQLFTHFDRLSGLPGRNIYSVTVDHNGHTWVGTSPGGVAKQENGLFHKMPVDSGFPDFKVKKLYTDWDGRIWMGTDGAGIYVYDSNRVTVFNSANGLKGNWIRDIIQDVAGNYWIAKAGGGISVMQSKGDGSFSFTYRHYGPQNGLAEDRVNCLVQDKQGRIWYGTANNGLGYITSDTIINFSISDGLGSNKIRSLALDPSGLIWAGTADAGLIKIDMEGNRAVFKKVDVQSGLRSNNIYLLGVDNEGNILSGSETGLDKITLNSSRSILEIRHYGLSEGFTGIETSQNAVYKDAGGNLWFGTINGLTRFNPLNTSRNDKAPLMQLRGISLFYQPLELTPYSKVLGDWKLPKQDIHLPYNKNLLGFEFFGVNHRNPEQVKYQWKLEGLETEWSPPSNRNNVTYSNLAPGEYRFLVKACNEDNKWSEPLQIPFVIKPPFWMRWWFIGSSGFVLLGSVWSIFRMRENRIKRKARETQEKLQMETDLLRLEQKALQLQMNPHFIFNALNSIQAHIGRNDEKNARYFLSKFSRLMRLILESSRETTIPLETEVSILDLYLSLENFSNGNRFSYNITIDESIDREAVCIPPMMIQPFVENAVIHGVIPSDKPGRIDICFRADGENMICSITDNGIGRKKALERKSQQEQNHKSTALVVTQERLDLLYGVNSESLNSLIIEDLCDNEGNSAGTRVSLRVPCSN